MKNCVFCKIVRGELPSAKIWEDKNFIAILNLFPNTKGSTLVISKKHYTPYAFDLSDDFYKKTMLASKKVAKLLEKKLPVKRIAMVMEGMAIPHLHIKLYPLHGLAKKFEVRVEAKHTFFQKYPGYISTVDGPIANMKELKKLSAKIRK